MLNPIISVQSIVVIGLGAVVGATLRWLLSLTLNAAFPAMPLGTLIANLSGGYLIGVAVYFFALHPTLSPQWALLIVTGFLGSLTTFSGFSLEVVTLIQQGRILGGFALIGVHVLGSVTMTGLGMGSVVLIRRFI